MLLGRRMLLVMKCSAKSCSSACCFQTFRGSGREKFTLLFTVFVLPPFMMFFFFCSIFFDCALFLQCSHVTSMQSPYVLNSNVVNYRRILQRKKKKTSLSVYQRLCKNDTPVNTHKQMQWWQSPLMHVQSQILDVTIQGGGGGDGGVISWPSVNNIFFFFFWLISLVTNYSVVYLTKFFDKQHGARTHSAEVAHLQFEDI